MAIDGVGARHSGAASVLLAVLDALLRNGGFEKIVVFCSREGGRSFARTDGRIKWIPVSWAEWPVGRVLWYRHGLARWTRMQAAQGLLCLGGGGVAPPGTGSVTLVQQSLPFSDEALSTLGARQRFRMQWIGREMARACGRSDVTVVQTPSMAKAVRERFRLPPERVRVILPSPLACTGIVDEPRLGDIQSTHPSQRLLYVGNASPYKNLSALVGAFRAVRAARPDAVLFATVPKGHPLTETEGSRSLGHLTHRTCLEAIRMSTGLVLPSLTESCGLPLLEAMGLGTPIAVADRPYAHDTCEDAALYFDPLDQRSIADAILRLLSDATLRQELITRGRRVVESRRLADPYGQLANLLFGLAVSSTRRGRPFPGSDERAV